MMGWVDMTNKTEKIRENRLRGEAAHFAARRAPLVANLENPVQILEGEAHGQGVAD